MIKPDPKVVKALGIAMRQYPEILDTGLEHGAITS